MCNRYHPARRELYWEEFRAMPPENLPVGPIFPRKPGPFIRADADGERQVVVGQWGLIPWFAKELPLKYSTNNARIETVSTAATYKQSWARGRRCIIPAQSFDEPNWESGVNEWWRFRRADGRAWGLAGLWSMWLDKSTGEVVESYTMLTMNADTHPLMRRMHKPDPKSGAARAGQALDHRNRARRLGHLARTARRGAGADPPHGARGLRRRPG